MILKDILKKIYKFKKVREYKKVCFFNKNVVFDKKLICEGANRIGFGSTVLNTNLGYASYLGELCFLKNCKFGNTAV